MSFQFERFSNLKLHQEKGALVFEMDVQFCAELTDFKIIYNVLKSILFMDFAIIQPLEDALQITIDHMRCVEAKAYIPKNLFTSYYSDPNETVKFKLSLKILTECLHIYGDDANPSLKMTYKGSGYPLCLVLNHKDENVTVDCEINTMNDVDDSFDINLSCETFLNKAVFNAAQFVDILSDLDNVCDEFELMFSPDPAFIRIITKNEMGESRTDIPKNSEMVTLFQCNDKFVEKYIYSNIRQFHKAMSYANKVSISTADSGLLQIQLSIAANDKQIFIDYYVSAMFSDND